MELDPSGWRVGMALSQDITEQFNQNRLFRGLACASLGLWSMGVASAAALSLTDRAETGMFPTYEGATSYTEDDVQAYVESINQRTESYANVQQPAPSSPPTSEQAAQAAVITTTTEAPPPTHTESRTPVSSETAAAVAAMNLTPEGYQQFFSAIDMSWFDYAQNLVNFNPDLVSDSVHAGAGAIAQNATEWVTAHYTASYTNPDGPGSTPIGEMVVNRLIDFLSDRGRPCCAINFIIDRHGKVIQTAPYWAKLRHNPPYDGRTVGFEIEAADQSQITSKQYESAAYLTIAILQNSELLNNRPLVEIFRGHGEMRDPYREQNPGTIYGQRNDFDEPIMNIFRPEIEVFLQNTPQIAQLTQPLR